MSYEKGHRTVWFFNHIWLSLFALSRLTSRHFPKTGLDFHYDNSPRDVQEKSFRAHIHAARETSLPLVIHNRDSDDDMIRILREEQAKGAFPGLIHCFSSGQELAKNIMEIGLSLSFSGIVTFKTAETLRDVARSVPMDRILVETDSPYLAPVPHRGRPNQPAHLVEIVRRIAVERQLSFDQAADVTTANGLRFFQLPERETKGQ